MRRRGLWIFAVAVGILSGAIAAALTFRLGLEGETDLNDWILVSAIGALVTAIVGVAAYVIARDDDSEG